MHGSLFVISIQWSTTALVTQTQDHWNNHDNTLWH